MATANTPPQGASETPPRYLRNPDVVFREEDEDGALLFNPDTNGIRVLNATGVFIWKLCDGTLDAQGIASRLDQEFEGVPPGEVVGQVQAFISEMVAAGYIGTVEK